MLLLLKVPIPLCCYISVFQAAGYGQITSHSSLDPASGDMSWEAWFRCNNKTGDDYIYGNYDRGCYSLFLSISELYITKNSTIN